MKRRLRRGTLILLLLLCIMPCFLGADRIEAATRKEAESDGYNWYTNFGDGTGNHYMLNLPIADWKSSAPAGSLFGGTKGVDYIVQNGSFVANPVTWQWSDIKNLTMTNSNVWKSQTINGKAYDYTNFGTRSNGSDGYLSFYRYDGTFYIDPEYNMSGMKFAVIPVSESPYTYSQVDSYVFIYPMCLKNSINNSTFMNYLVYWNGTQMIWAESQYFHGRQGIPLYYYDYNSPPDAFGKNLGNWYSKLTTANASSVVAYGWNQVKNRSDYDGRWGITVVNAANGGGHAYRLMVGAEFNPNQILYDGNGATSGRNGIQYQYYGQTVYIKDNWFKKDGYTFTGWNDRADGSGTSYKPGQAYSSVRPLKLFAQWKRDQYTITYHGNGATGGSTAKQTCNVNDSYNLNANGFTRTGYTFKGWNTKPDGSGTSYADKASIKNLSTTNGANIDLYAIWQANQYTVHFDANGGNGSMADITLTYDQPENLPANAFTKENGYGASTFKGWNTVNNTLDVLYADGAQVVNLADTNNTTITLYAIWDDCPWITAEDLYYTLDQAQTGFITHDELMSHAVAEDREDGSPIPSGQDEETGTMFWIPDYQESDFTQFQSEGSVTETYRVQDSAGNIYKKMITVYIVDTTAVAVQPVGTTRFIDEHYYNQPYENGGLEDKSIWKTDPEYVATIQDAFANLRNDTPEQSYHFTHETILEMQDYVDVHGIGNSKEPDALQNFYDRFMAPNRVN